MIRVIYFIFKRVLKKCKYISVNQLVKSQSMHMHYMVLVDVSFAFSFGGCRSCCFLF